MPLSRNISNRGLALIEEFEGFRRDLYNDLTPQLPISHPNSDGHCTVGIGHKVHDGICDGRGSEAPYRNGISHADALALKKKDAKRYVKGVNDAVTVPLNQNQFDALVSFTFNLGVGTLQRATFLGRLNKGKYAAVPPGLKLYVKAKGKRLEGLVRRRQAEADLWNTPPDEEEDEDMNSWIVKANVEGKDKYFLIKQTATLTTKTPLQNAKLRRVFVAGLGEPKDVPWAGLARIRDA